jgi:hypothetical protein
LKLLDFPRESSNKQEKSIEHELQKRSSIRTSVGYILYKPIWFLFMRISFSLRSSHIHPNFQSSKEVKPPWPLLSASSACGFLLSFIGVAQITRNNTLVVVGLPFLLQKYSIICHLTTSLD